MKNISFFLFVISVSITINLKAHNFEINYLEMVGVVKQNIYFQQKSEVYVAGTKVTVFNEDKKIISTCYSNNLGKCNFKLPINGLFSILFSKDNYVSKTISVDTKLPKDKESTYMLKFDVYLFEFNRSIDVSILSDPIAKVNFDKYFSAFIYDVLYTDAVNNAIRKKYSEFYMADLKNKIRFGNKPDSNVSEDSFNISSEILKIDSVGKNEEQISFRIQLVALKEQKLPLNSELFSFCGEVKESFSDEMYKYSIGDFADLNSAHKKLIEYVDMGFTDSFVYANKGNDRISIIDALIILNK